MKPPSLLCTAEAFGFGPSAALHQIHPHLRELGYDLSYLGCGWTLEMHTRGMYQSVQDVDVRKPDGRALCRQALANTPALLSVCDLKAAQVGVESGAPTILYEVLAWFRRPAPPVYRRVQRLVCPDFFGVREALQESGVMNAHVVPPLMPVAAADVVKDAGVVVNLGGLQTPYTDVRSCAQYAQRMVDAVGALLGPPLVLTSATVGQYLERCEVRTVGPVQARSYIAKARCSFLTGGIGNIMDAAGLQAPVCFLPPMSQSQGLQLALLRQHVPMVPTIAWREIAANAPIDYHAGHTEVMPAIAQRIAAASAPAGTKRLHACIRQALDALDQPNAGHALHDALLQRFGRDDGRQAAAAIVAGLVPQARQTRDSL